MTEYVKRKDVISEIKRTMRDNELFRPWCFVIAVNNTPGTDVRENKHAVWIAKDFDFGTIWECSNCRHQRLTGSAPRFCENCGAEMR